MSRISRLSRSNVNKNNENSNNSINRRSIIQVITLLDHEHTVTGSSVGFLLQSYKYIGSDGLQITATRLPQNAPNRIWNSKNFQGVIPPDGRTPVPDWESAKVATLRYERPFGYALYEFMNAD